MREEHQHHDHSHAADADAQAATVYTCPMHPQVRRDAPGDCPECGMKLVPEAEAAGQDHQDHEAPGGAAGGAYDTVPAGWSGAVYTCPMHPEVRQTEPGSCPICGMGLELESGTGADEGTNPELVDFTRRLWIGAALTVPLLVLTMGPLLGLEVRSTLGERTTLWIELPKRP